VVEGTPDEEFTLTLSRPSVPAGELGVEAVNQGQDPHNLRMRREDGAGPTHALPESGEIQSGETAEGTFALDTGAWRLYCELPGHEAAGMRATLRVEP